jgi:FKBP-type peptidyl-prolyl cis-trans isomerase FkpA
MPANPAGLVFKSIKPANGAQPGPDDTVRVHYEGRLENGAVFDSSYERGHPESLPLKAVIKCWSEGVQKMHVGEKAELICPPSMAYGDRGAPPKIPPNATLIFDVELLGIEPH